MELDRETVKQETIDRKREKGARKTVIRRKWYKEGTGIKQIARHNETGGATE